MSAHETHDARQYQVVFDAQREWAIYRCSHGCHHVLLDRVSLTLTSEEFRALHDLMERASHRSHEQSLSQETLPERTH
jgi:hypothetical protein